MSAIAEIELWLEDDYTTTLFIMAPTGNHIVASLEGVSGNPFLYQGTWAIPCIFMGRPSTAYLPQNLVGWFLRFDDTTPRETPSP